MRAVGGGVSCAGPEVRDQQAKIGRDPSSI